jgi:hypothetical protein
MIPPMRRLYLAVALAMAIHGPAKAQTIVSAAAAQGLLCRSAVAEAERSSGIPAQLLAAISRVESGRRDPLTGTMNPWPWSVNAEGQGSFYDTKAEAVAAVRAMQARGVQSIDVGCGQINLMHHPNAFPNLETAFDPQANAAYAARFLKELFVQSGNWTKAAGLYHSATPELGEDYRQKVMAIWPEEQRLAGLVGTTPLAQAWGATLTAPPPAFMRVMRALPPGATRGPQIIMQSNLGGMASPGRGLDAYRATPIGLAFQPPPRRIGG